MASKDRHPADQECASRPVAARQLGEVLDLMAHDLKNPLAAILTNVAFVRAWLANVDPAQVEGLEDIREAIVDAAQAGDAVQRYVGNLELLAREVDGALVRIEPGPIDVIALVEEALIRHREGASGRGLSLVFEPPSFPVWARADRELVVRAFDNLVSNAIQHAPRRSKIEIRVSIRGTESVMTVLDEGAKVPPALRGVVVTYVGQGQTKNHPEGRYGRGLALLGAAVAARLTGGTLTIGEVMERSALELSIPHLGDHESPRPPFAVVDVREPS